MQAQIIGQSDCKHFKCREEEFFTLLVEIKNKKKLHESLEALVAGEFMEGAIARHLHSLFFSFTFFVLFFDLFCFFSHHIVDVSSFFVILGSYKCEFCNKKVDILKRQVISKLPPTLCIALKRFELDFNTFQSIKINSRMEFPLDLDMRPYTAETLLTPELAERSRFFDFFSGVFAFL